MKLKHILPVLGLLLASACADEFPYQGRLQPGEDVYLTLGVEMPQIVETQVLSRASADADLNSQIYDFYLLIFDAATDELRDKYYFPTIRQGDNSCSAQYSSNPYAMITIGTEGNSSAVIKSLHTKAGQARIVGVANVNRKGDSMILDEVAAVKNFDELCRITTRERNEEASVFVCSGFYSEVGQTDSDGIVNITDTVLKGTVKLHAVESRVKFVIASSDSINFNLDSWEVYNLPGATTLFPLSGDNSSEHFNIGAQTARDNSFAFFCLENTPTPSNKIADANLPAEAQYGARAAWTGSADAKNFTYAPSTATYVVLHGQFDNKKEGKEKVYGDVTYTIFLGESSVTDSDDYTVNRNKRYTYNIEIQGVNQILTWIETDDGSDNERPDAEGHLYSGDGRTIPLDCHYEQYNIDLDWEYVDQVLKVNEVDGIKMIQVAGRVPAKGYSKVYSYSGGDLPSEEADAFRWIEVTKHDGTEPENETGYLSYTISKQRADKGDPTALMTVSEFLKDLYEFGNDESNKDKRVEYTFYFDEYIYEDLSWKDIMDAGSRTFSFLGTDAQPSPDNASTMASPGITFSQLPVRTIYNPASNDVKIAWGIESIEEMLRANGVKTIRGVAEGQGPTEKSIYGRQNNWRQLHVKYPNAGTLPFSDIIDVNGYLVEQPCMDATNKNKNTTSTELIAACMTRNRDLNGNGKLDPNEFRWYVPSIEQMQELYVAQETLPSDVQLYDPTDSKMFDVNNWKFKHYVSSSKVDDDSSKDIQILWSEEGGSTGGAKDDWRLMGEAPNKYQPDYYVRCARDLGRPVTNDSPWNLGSEMKYDRPYVLKDAEAGTNHVAGMVDMSRTNLKAIRTNLELKDVSGVVNTFSYNNRPALMFEYADTIIEMNFTRDNNKAENPTLGDTECHRVLGAGWRTPSNRELSVLFWEMGADVMGPSGNRKSLLTRTQYVHFANRYWYPGKTNEGRYVHILQAYGTRFVLGNWTATTQLEGYQYENGWVRCVRDYIPGVK